MRDKKSVAVIVLIMVSFLLTGCAESKTAIDSEASEGVEDTNSITGSEALLPGNQDNRNESSNVNDQDNRNKPGNLNNSGNSNDSDNLKNNGDAAHAPADISEADWSDYFHGLSGSAVIYVPSQNKYMVYNKELSEIQRSPCSTFKIISSLFGIENDVIKEEDSLRKWSGEDFWNEKWNRDIDFKDAFQASCIWYFREVTDELGQDTVQEQLDLLDYGNCDISDWEGHLNNSNNNPALKGFWVESSLKISPKEQTEVMERIFGENTVYSPKTLNMLKDAMLVTDSDTSGLKIYGKTGMGKSSGVTVDAWYTGFSEIEEEKVYFCIYLGRSDGMDVTSTEAKKIAIQIICDNFRTNQ